MEEIILSCIIPVYNTEKYIDRCLMSIINQDIANVEIILVDDGSTDGSGEICEKYKSKYPEKILLIHKENEGLSAARNTGIEHAKGKFIRFIDSDDYLEGNALKEIIPLLDEKIDIYEMGYNILGADNFKKTELPIRSLYPVEPRLYLKNSMKEGAYYWSAWRFIFNKKFFDESGLLFPKGRNYEDIYLIPRLMLSANLIKSICVVEYNYIFGRAESITNVHSLKNNEDMLWAISDNMEYFQNIKDYELKILLLDNLSRTYYIALMNLYRIKDKYEREALLESLKQKKWITNYTISGPQAIVKRFMNLFGIKITSRLLYIRMRIKMRIK